MGIQIISAGSCLPKLVVTNNDLSKEDIDLVICGTATPDVCVPTVAANIKKSLGIERAAAFDMNTNCSSFVYAITVAESLMKNCNYRNAIVVGADINSQILNWKDRSTAVLFGDGAGAVILSNTKSKGILSTHLDCVIDSDNALTCNKKINSTPFFNNVDEKDTKIVMNGQGVLRFATKAFTEAVYAVIDKANISMDDIKLIIPHQ